MRRKYRRVLHRGRQRWYGYVGARRKRYPEKIFVQEPYNPIFVNQFTHTKAYHYELDAYAFFKKPILRVLYAIILVIFIVNLLPLLFSNITHRFVWVAFWMPLFALLVNVLRYFAHVNLSYKRELEMNYGQPLEVMSFVTDYGADYRCDGIASLTHTPYSQVQKAIQTKNYYVLLTKAEIYYAFKKDSFTKGTSEEFVQFFKDKGYKL